VTTVEIRGLEVAYEGTRVLNGIDVTIADGEFFFLLGPSGCGKTTLLRAIAGFVEPSGGEIRFGTRSMTTVPAAKRDCGMVFQNYALWPHLTVAQNVAFGLDVRKVEKNEKARRVAEALRLVRMEEYAERLPSKLSGGQQQRVALARAIVVDPTVLLLDEPLSNLDAKLRVDLRAEILEIQRRTRRTAIYVTHDRSEALALADRIAVLRGGSIEQIGTPREIYDAPTSSFVAGFVGDVASLRGAGTAAGEGVVEVEGPFGRLEARVCGPAPGSDCEVVIRPERLVLERGGAPGKGRLAAVVRRGTFLGETTQYEVEVGGGSVLRSLVLSGGPPIREGEEVIARVVDALAYPVRAGAAT
jgi:ABC-type Fe3+/spermidine/putrescine transport system ATPase subunit